eukprot:gene2246-2769_t
MERNNNNNNQYDQDDDYDVFEDTVFLESNTYNSSRKQGENDGARLGYVEGYQFGFNKGVELGQEIGYYQSCVTVWNHLVTLHKDNSKFSNRGLQNLEKLTNLLKDYNLNFHDENVMSTLSDIRMKFKLTSAQLGLQTKEQNELSF